MARDVLHVVPQNESWAVKREGNERSSSSHSTQKDAIDSARELAHEGDDIVIHRPDGTVRERITYGDGQANAGRTETGNGRARAFAAPEVHDVLGVGSRVSWQAILAGLAVTIATYVLLTLLAIAIGLSTVDYLQGRTFTIGAAIVGIFCVLAALFAGGCVITRLSTRETMGEAIIYGVILWAALFFTLLLTGMNLGTSFGLMSQVTGERSLAGRPAGAEPAQIQTSEEAQRARNVLAQSEQIASELKPSEMAWWTFGGVLLSLLAAIAGALAGAGPELRFSRFFGARPAAPGTRLAVDNR